MASKTTSLLIALLFAACASNRLPNFFPYPVTEAAQWNEPIPANKSVPVLEEIYAHRSPLEDGIVYVNGKKVSKLLEPTGTIAHELIHGINSYLRGYKKGHSGFYVPYVGAAQLKDTRAKRNQLAAFIPKELRGIDGNGGRFHQYVQTAAGTEPDAGTYFDPSSGQKLWGQTDVFYIWDEWNAYIYGGRADLEAEQKFGPEHWDSMTGPVEFMIYSLAGLMAIQQYDQTYGQSSDFEDAKALFIFLAEDTVNLLSDGQGSSLFPEKSNLYLKRFRESQSREAQAMRSFVKTQLGEDWAKKYLGI